MVVGVVVLAAPDRLSDVHPDAMAMVPMQERAVAVVVRFMRPVSAVLSGSAAVGGR
jgi:hypothetical protein